MDDINTVMKLKKSIRKLEQEKERAKGRVEHSLKMLKEEFDCSSLKQAKKELEIVGTNQRRLKTKYKKEEKVFMKKWGDKLELEIDE